MADLVERLATNHLRMLREESGLPDEIIEARGYFTATEVREIRALGFSAAQAIVPALVLPLWGVDGKQTGHLVRPDSPRMTARGKVIKYEARAKVRPILDVPPACLAALGDPLKPLYITEGCKKADALAAHGACAISISGVWNWRGTNDLGGKQALADWEHVALNDRLVRIVFDSDVTTKLEVQAALKRLKALLERRQAHARVVYLPQAEDGSKQGVDDFLAAGHSLVDVDRLTSDELLPVARMSDLPEIVVNGRHLEEIADDCWKVLAAKNDRSPFAFRREGQLVSIRFDDRREPRIHDWADEDVVFVMERHARFVSHQETEAGIQVRPARIPKDIVADMRVAWNKPLPVLRGIVRTPVFGADGELATRKGYQSETQLYYAPLGPPVPQVPGDPTGDDVARAVALVDEWLHDFPFSRPSCRAHAIAAALTPLVRDLIEGPTPLFAVDAPKEGTGKGLLSTTITLIVTGQAPAVMAYPRDADEERKRYTAVLREGAQVILLDNVLRPLASDVLCAVITSETWSDRVLGSSAMARLPNRALWIVTGNNLQMTGEVARRTVPIRLDSRRDRPYERTGFLHPDLPGWVRERRANLVWSLLVLTQHWIASGRPGFSGLPLATFERWSHVVGGALELAGIEGFLGDRNELYRTADAETEEWRDLVLAWWERFQDDLVKVSDLVPFVRDDELLPSLMASARDTTEQGIKVRLGKNLAKRRDQRIGDHFLRAPGKDGHQKGLLYRLEAAEDAEDRHPCQDNPPHDNRSTLDSLAEDAEGAEDFQDLRARETIDFTAHDLHRPSAAAAVGNDTPQTPHPPQSDSQSADFAAEDWSDGDLDPPHPPRGRTCLLCPRELSVVAISDICGDCLRLVHVRQARGEEVSE